VGRFSEERDPLAAGDRARLLDAAVAVEVCTVVVRRLARREQLGGVPLAGVAGAGGAGTVADPSVGIQTKDGEFVNRRGTGDAGERKAGDADSGACQEPLA